MTVCYRRHDIKTFRARDLWKARAFRGQYPIGEIVTAPSEEAAIASVKGQLDDIADSQLALRGPDGFPTVHEVRAAWQRIEPSASALQIAMLKAHIRSPDHILTATQLARAAGFDDYVIANLHYGKLGFALAEEMEWKPKEQRQGGEPIWTFTLATNADENERNDGVEITGEWRWKLRPKIVEALAQIC